MKFFITSNLSDRVNFIQYAKNCALDDKLWQYGNELDYGEIYDIHAQAFEVDDEEMARELFMKTYRQTVAEEKKVSGEWTCPKCGEYYRKLDGSFELGEIVQCDAPDGCGAEFQIGVNDK